MSSQAYTPGLKRKEICTVRKTRRLPIPGEVLVKEGDKVSQDTIVARTTAPGRPRIAYVAHDLGLDTDVEKIENFLLKGVGKTVEKNEQLARYEVLFGLIKKTSLSPVTGTVESISNVTGQVIVRELPIPIEVRAYVPGVIAEVLPREGVVVQTSAALVQGVFGIGGENCGELKIMSKTPEDVLVDGQITTGCAGKVLVAGALVTAEALRKALDVGAKGIVVGGIVDRDLTDFLGYEIGVAITGHEEISTTLILTEGFGKMKMLDRTFVLLKGLEGKLACVNGATQIRAGVIRPEVIVPRNDVPFTEIAELREEAEQAAEGLRPGMLVRLIREPYFGALGKVVSLPAGSKKMQTESDVRVLEVELEDGRRVTKARANVEIIEE